ncbi:hypothetical protein GCM10023195_55270 [Actinoallomurus liliacearum]|uniref:Uncharacterized protein n=1 Tax=Actinoallomurus liliacearum TaxID=1080073 RepID=A0ABP8TSZ3_9ACTN
MRKTSTAGTARDLKAIAAERFPLVPRPKPVCRSLQARVARVCERAHLAAQGADEPLIRAAEAHNLAALIASDCGLPELAHSLCWRQFDVFLTASSLDAGTARIALQPLINLARLRIRDGDGITAYRMLDALFNAVRSRTDVVIDGRTIQFGHLIGDDGHREVIQWLWSVLLTDGTRALTRTGRWAEALQHTTQHNGIGNQLLDGRQVAILARATAGNYDSACRLLADTCTTTSWEETVTSCLNVLCLRLADRPTSAATATMLDRYLSFESEHVVFHVRLGLTVLDLAADHSDVPRVADVTVQAAVESGDAYAAQEVLAHETCRPYAPVALIEMVQFAGLGCATIPANLLETLTASIRISEGIIATVLAGGAEGSREWPAVGP